VRLRRYLIEHRFNAAQGALGVVALTAGLWLLWPAPPDRVVEHHDAWQRSLQMASQDFIGRNEAFRDGLVPVTTASLAASAKTEMPAGMALADRRGTGVRLAQIARTMPAIGVPESGPATAEAVDLAVDLPARLTRPVELGAAATAMRSATAVATANAKPEWVLAQALPRRPPPIVEDHGTPTWLRNAVAAPLADGRPAIAVVVDDLGLNRRGTAALNQLKGPLTLSFLPYAGALEEQARAGRAAGHELLLHMPMEPTGHEWPGPNALLSTLAPHDLVARLRAQLASFPGFVGVNNHMGSLLTAEQAPMALVMAELRSRGLLFLDSRTTAQSVAGDEAQRAGVAHAARDVFLDNDLDLASIRRQLALTERIARRRGSAVAIGHPHDATIEALRGWLPSLERRGFVLVPVSSIVARESCADGLLASPTACGLYVSAHNTVE
jgi:polysaccharide deacetylase 2 family uncharacterized protein YibQ